MIGQDTPPIDPIEGTHTLVYTTSGIKGPRFLVYLLSSFKRHRVASMNDTISVQLMVSRDY